MLLTNLWLDYTKADHDHLYTGDLPSSTDGFSLTSLETRFETTKFNDRPSAYALNHISKRKETSVERQQQKQTRKISFKSIYQKGNFPIRPEISKDIISWAQSNHIMIEIDAFAKNRSSSVLGNALYSQHTLEKGPKRDPSPSRGIIGVCGYTPPPLIFTNVQYRNSSSRVVQG